MKQTLIDQNQQHWFLQLLHSNKGKMYSIFKEAIKFENHLIDIK